MCLQVAEIDVLGERWGEGGAQVTKLLHNLLVHLHFGWGQLRGAKYEWGQLAAGVGTGYVCQHVPRTTQQLPEGLELWG